MAIYKNNSILVHVEAVQFGVDDFPEWAHKLAAAEEYKDDEVLSMFISPDNNRQIFVLTTRSDKSSCFKGDYLVKDLDCGAVFLFSKSLFQYVFPENSKIKEKNNESPLPYIACGNGAKYFHQLAYEFGMEVSYAKSFKEFIGNREFEYVNYGRGLSIKIKVDTDKWLEVKDNGLITIDNNGILTVTNR